MKKIFKYLLIASIGFPTGYVLRGLAEQPIDRVERAIALFEAYCLPYAFFETPLPPEGFIEQTDLLKGLSYTDPASVLTLEFKSNQCELDDRFMHFSKADRALLELAFAQLIASRLPSLFKDPNKSLNWDAEVYWRERPMPEQQNLVLGLSRIRSEGTQLDYRRNTSLIVMRRRSGVSL